MSLLIVFLNFSTSKEPFVEFILYWFQFATFLKLRGHFQHLFLITLKIINYYSSPDTLSDKSYHSEGDEKQSAYLAATVDTEKRVLLFSWYGKHPVQLNHERKFSGILRDGDAVAFGKNHDHEYVCEFSPPQKKIPRDIDPDFPDWDFKETRRVKKKRNEGKQKKIKRKFPKWNDIQSNCNVVE